MLVSAQGRLRHPQPDQGLRPGQGLRVHRHARRPLDHGAVAVVVGDRRSARLLRPHREVAHADPAERADAATSRTASTCARSTIPSRPTISPDGRQGRVRGAAGRRRRHLRRRPADEEDHQPDQGRFADSAPTWSPDGRSLIYLARISGNEKLFRVDVATGRKTQLTFGTHDDARGAVPGRGHARLLVDGDRPGAADRSRRGAQRQHLQHLDAEPEERRAAAVHRRGRRQPVRRSSCKDGDSTPRDRRHQLLQGRVRAAHARAPRPDRHRRLVRLRRARPESSTSRRRCRTRWSPTRTRRRARSRRCSSTAGRR